MRDIQSLSRHGRRGIPCDVCKDLRKYLSFKTLAEVEAAAIQGCSTCAFLRDSIVAVVPEAGQRPEDAILNLSTSYRLSSSKSTLEISVTIADKTTYVHYFTLAGKSNLRRHTLTRQPV